MVTTGPAPFVPTGNVKPCCREAGNLELAQTTDDGGSRETVWKCRVCQCRHFDVTITPARFGLEG